VSADGSSTIINATFIEKRVDYGELFTYVQNLVKRERDAHHQIYVAGFPIMTGGCMPSAPTRRRYLP